MIRFSVSPCLPSHRGLSALALLLAFFEAPAIAAPQISQGTWTEYVAAVCYNSPVCRATFTPVPAGKTYIVRNIACLVMIPPTASFMNTFLTGNSRTNYLILSAGNIVAGRRNWYVNDDVFVPYVAGQRPAVGTFLVQTASPITVACTLSGEFRPSDLPI